MSHLTSNKGIVHFDDCLVGDVEPVLPGRFDGQPRLVEHRREGLRVQRAAEQLDPLLVAEVGGVW